MRWRIVYRQSDGTLSSRRGFTSRTAAATARRKLVESIDRGEVKVSREDFETFWNRFVATGALHDGWLPSGSHVARSQAPPPVLRRDALSKIDEDRVREWLALMVEIVEAGELAPKTINNARTCLSVAFNEAVRRGLMARNPCANVAALPLDPHEVEYLRLAEIGPYLDTCVFHHRALGEFLIGTGSRVSEAVAIRWTDVDLEHGVVRIYRQPARDSYHGVPRGTPLADDGPTATRHERAARAFPRRS